MYIYMHIAITMNINELFTSLRFPVNSQIGAYPLLLLNGKGRILEAWNTDSFARPSIIKALMKAPSVFGAFDFKDLTNLEEIDFSKGPGIFVATRLPALESGSNYGFHTRLPVGRLYINPAGKGRFLGTFAFFNYYTETQNHANSAIFWVDGESGTIEGFNPRLLSHLSPRFRTPADLLGAAAEEVLSPSPRKIREEALAKHPCPPAGSFPLRYRLEKDPEKAEADLAFPKKDREGTHVWENRSPTHDFLRLPFAMDPLAVDFSLETIVEILSGSCPLLIAGSRATRDVFPDDQGYTAGLDAGRGGAFLKREGMIIAEGKNSEAPEGALFSLALVKTGFNLFFIINGRVSIACHDFDFLECAVLTPYLGLRPGSRVRIRSLSFRTREAGKRLVRKDPVVRLKGERELYFILKRLINASLPANHPGLESYSLHNVTAIQTEKKELMAIVAGTKDGQAAFISADPAMERIREQSRVAAEKGAPILIQGETGSGKEVLARHIHAHGPYKNGPFIKVDCSTLAPSLVESELFGHEKGAFTGALSRKKGKFEEADNGVLFIDEIGNLGPELQAKLLQFLQDFTVTRVGGVQPVKLSLQIITASNLRLETLVRQGRFREDLFHRINVFSFTLPPLRERRDDLPQLCRHFLGLYAAQYGKATPRLSGEAYKKLYAHPWPGNIRELKNALQRAVAFCEGSEIRESDLTLTGETAGTGVRNRCAPRQVEISRAALEKLAQSCRGNVRRMARELSVTRVTLYKLLKRQGLSIREHRIKAGQALR